MRYALLLVLFLFLGCVNPPVSIPIDQPIEEIPSDEPSIPVEENEPVAITDQNIFIVNEVDGIHLQNQGTEDLVYSPKNVCENGVCLLGVQYSSDVSKLTVHVSSDDFNILNKNDFPLNKHPAFTVAVTEEPVMKTCVFSYAANDHTYVSNYFATFKHVCLFLDELETETGIPVHPNYALVWNSQFNTAGEYLGSDIIYLSQENPFKLSPTIMHELTHSLMQDARFPNWINEGLAEYYADQSLDIFHPKTGYAEGVEDWSFGPIDSNLNVSSEYYESAHTIVQNFGEVYGEDTLRELTHYFIDHPLIRSHEIESIQENTEIVLAKMRDLTGDENIVSVKYLAELHKKKN